MSENSQGILALVGRILLSLIFILSAFNKLGNVTGTTGYMAAHGMPAVKFFLVMAVVFELLGGLMVLSGYRARLGAVLLIVFIVPATLIFHNFWAFEGMERQQQMINFLKNISILGGLLVVVGLGPGNIAVGRKKG